MEKIIFRVIIVTSACCLSAKYVYIQKQLSWSAAREYCRNSHVDLLPLTNSLEEDVLRAAVDYNDRGWIGVYWDQTTNTWRWSGGDIVTFWKNLYMYLNPFNELQEPYTHVCNVYWTKEKWFFREGTHLANFFCLSLTVVQEEKTWEEALEHCTENQANFTSLLSVTENLLATNEIQQTSITERVWIGLCYLGDSWLWVNGDSLDYENWSQGGDQDHQCPMKRRCGSLTKEGVWENQDCQEKLSFICG